MTIFHVLTLMLLGLGVYYGFTLGAQFLGFAGGLLGGVLGACLGVFGGNLVLTLCVLPFSHKLSGKTTEELRAELRSRDCLVPNLLLLELKTRGHVSSEDLDIVITSLGEPTVDRRGRAWVALNSAFPELLSLIPEYEIGGDLEDCKKSAARLKEVAAQRRRAADPI